MPVKAYARGLFILLLQELLNTKKETAAKMETVSYNSQNINICSNFRIEITPLSALQNNPQVLSC